MNLCDDGHEEMCFNGHYCPLCVLIKDSEDAIEWLKNEIIRLDDEIAMLDGVISDLES